MTIAEAKRVLKPGMVVRTNGDEFNSLEPFEGIVGCMHEGSSYFTVMRGSRGAGCACGSRGWKIYWNNLCAYIDILGDSLPIGLHGGIASCEASSSEIHRLTTTYSKKSYMTSIIEKFRRLTASAEEKLLVKYGIENPIGVPTAEGYDLSDEISYKANRAAVIESVKKIDEEAQKEKR